jgi:ribosomal protein S9
MPVPIAVGRRKNAVARVKLTEGSGKITINKRELEKYFPLETHRTEVSLPFVVTDTLGRYDASVNVNGGGMTGQAGAIKLGIARSRRYQGAVRYEVRASCKAVRASSRRPSSFRAWPSLYHPSTLDP